MRNAVTVSPCSRGIRLQKMMNETASAARESAVAGLTAGIINAIEDAIITERLRNVSAQIC